MDKDKIKAARVQLGQYFKNRREEMGASVEQLAQHLGISANTMRGIESGRFAWDIDMHFRICQALEIKPYFSTTPDPLDEDFTLRKEDDPERYHGFYIVENLLLHPDQLGIVKLTYPRMLLYFNYSTSFTSFEDWKANHTEVQWLDPNDKPESEEEVEDILTDCWNFLALTEREEERLYEERRGSNEG